MTLVSQAIVIATEKCLKGATWAGENVLRQPIDPIPEIVSPDREQGPVLAVYVRSASFKVEGRQSQGTSGELMLQVFCYLAPKTRVVHDGLEITMDTSQAGLTLDIVARQIDAAFHKPAPGPWLDVWRTFVANITRREINYIMYEIENGLRLPVVEVSYTLTTIPDPDFVGNQTKAWQKLDAILRDPSEPAGSAMLADLFKSMITDPASVPDYAALQANFGLTGEALDATGLGPARKDALLPNGNTPGLTNINLDGNVDIVAPGD